MTTICDKAYSEKDMMYVQDALYVLSGKWKLLIILALSNGDKRFMEIQKSIPKITTKMLSKELKELETNNLIKRVIHEDYPVWIEYTFTEHSKALSPMIEEMIKWTKSHRRKIFEQVA
jgi:DNA-binding HxlR family transcriptional regulator